MKLTYFYRPIFNYGGSVKTLRLSAGALAKSAIGSSKITGFFTSKIVAPVEPPIIADEVLDDTELEAQLEQDAAGDASEDNIYDPQLLLECIQLLEKKTALHNNAKLHKKSKLTLFQFRQAQATQAFFQDIKDGHGIMFASINVARYSFAKPPNSYRCRIIRHWARMFYQHREFKDSMQGKHPKHQSIILVPEVKDFFKSELRALHFQKRTPATFQTMLRERLLDEVSLEFPELEVPESVSFETARNWMHYLGYKPELKKKGFYVDGHERADVVQHRREYVARMLSYQSRMRQFDEETMEPLIALNVELTLPNGQKELVWLYHDESTFYANDGTHMIWQSDEHQDLLPKSNGTSTMVSAFMCPCHGIMINPTNPLDVSYVIKECSGKNGWWDNDDLSKQTIEVLRLFELVHPGCIAVVNYDNSMNHHAMAPDALVVSRLNSSGGKKDVKMRDTTWGPNNTAQLMQRADGTQKGVKAILEERHLWSNPRGGRFCFECGPCSGRDLTPRPVPPPTDCCGKVVLSHQPDFVNQKEWLEEIVIGAGHILEYFPKYHCELNPIEMYWGWVKQYVRARCGYSIHALRVLVPEGLTACPLTTIRRHVRHCLRFMSGYTQDLEGPLLVYVMKLYTSHRRIPRLVIDEIQAKFDEQKTKVKLTK
jgi:hypothetical protein